MRLVNLAHGDFIIVAAYLALVAGQVLGLSPFLNWKYFRFGGGYNKLHLVRIFHCTQAGECSNPLPD